MIQRIIPVCGDSQVYIHRCAPVQVCIYTLSETNGPPRPHVPAHPVGASSRCPDWGPGLPGSMSQSRRPVKAHAQKMRVRPATKRRWAHQHQLEHPPPVRPAGSTVAGPVRGCLRPTRANGSKYPKERPTRCSAWRGGSCSHRVGLGPFVAVLGMRLGTQRAHPV